jgi:hypothetical protein
MGLPVGAWGLPSPVPSYVATPSLPRLEREKGNVTPLGTALDRLQARPGSGHAGEPGEHAPDAPLAARLRHRVGTAACAGRSFDALVAALVARAKAIGLCRPIPDGKRTLAAVEGWIALPQAGSLEQLPGGSPAGRRTHPEP